MSQEMMGGSVEHHGDEKMSLGEIAKRTESVKQELMKNLPEGIQDLSLGTEGSDCTIRVDSTDNAALDALLESLRVELHKVGLALGEHIPMGFDGSEQADAWYIKEM